MPSLVFQYLSNRASKASVIPSAVYSYLRSILTAGGARGCRVPFRLWCSRDFIWCSRDSLDILILYYTSLLFHSVANIYFFPLILFILWCWGLFSRTSYSFSSVHSYLRSILTAGRGGVSFPFFVRTTIYHTIFRLNISSVDGNDSHNPFSVLFYVTSLPPHHPYLFTT